MDRFYQDLPAFAEFGQIVNFAAYAAVPEDWVVALADIRGSTKAIKHGRYKDVNMAGAASITAVLNVCKPLEIPFVFGGDGGAVILPGAYANRADAALKALRTFTKQSLDLDLRIGVIPVSRLRQDGADILVNKFELSPGNYLAMVSGGGLERADELLKSTDEQFSSPQGDVAASTAPDLEGLSCRWQPLRPKKDHMIALLIRGSDAKGSTAGNLARVIDRIETALDGPAGQSTPVNAWSMRYRWPPKGLWLEARMTAPASATRSRFRSLLLESFSQLLCEKFSIKLGAYDGAKYRNEIMSNADFRKYDDILRMVLDVSTGQLQAITDLLEHDFAAGRLAFGLHVADSALMTCLIFSLEQSQHIHFIDAANGGFALAAIDFKARLKSLSN